MARNPGPVFGAGRVRAASTQAQRFGSRREKNARAHKPGGRSGAQHSGVVDARTNVAAHARPSDEAARKQIGLGLGPQRGDPLERRGEPGSPERGELCRYGAGAMRTAGRRSTRARGPGPLRRSPRGPLGRLDGVGRSPSSFRGHFADPHHSAANPCPDGRRHQVPAVPRDSAKPPAQARNPVLGPGRAKRSTAFGPRDGRRRRPPSDMCLLLRNHSATAPRFRKNAASKARRPLVHRHEVMSIGRGRPGVPR